MRSGRIYLFNSFCIHRDLFSKSSGSFQKKIPMISESIYTDADMKKNDFFVRVRLKLCVIYMKGVKKALDQY